jgi:2-succinyl-6-hydroxy-2,4-cyclohexadiene-1-carboxylate synthase
MDSLKAEFRCIALDLPGHGTSIGLPQETYTFEGSARSIIQLLDELQIDQTDQAVLVGYSMGGRLALYLALHHPERFTGLLLESTSPGLEKEEDCAARRAADEEKAQRLETEDFGEFLQDWYRQPLFVSLACDEAVLQETIKARKNNDPSELAKSLRGMGTGSQPSLWRGLHELWVPALAVTGELDEKFVGISRRMAASSTRLKMVVVAGVGHNVRLEAPGAYFTIMQEFMRSL